MSTAVTCGTCSGRGVLVAKYGNGYRYAPCPPCRGRGVDRSKDHGWDAGPVQDWLSAPSLDALEPIAAAWRAQARAYAPEERHNGRRERLTALRALVSASTH
jgi:hypothetical protein